MQLKPTVKGAFIREATAMTQVYVRVRIRGVVGQLQPEMSSLALATVMKGVEMRCALDSSLGCRNRLSTAALLENYGLLMSGGTTTKASALRAWKALATWCCG